MLKVINCVNVQLMKGETTPQDNPLRLYRDRNNTTYAEMYKKAGLTEATFYALLRKTRYEMDTISVKTARKLKKYFNIKLI